MARKKVRYPPPKTATKGGRAANAFEPRTVPSRTVSINTAAAVGQASIRVGQRVRISSGLYAGEAAIVESIASGVISSAIVRTDAGNRRRARTIDLEQIHEAAPEPQDRGEAADTDTAPGSEPGGQSA